MNRPQRESLWQTNKTGQAIRLTRWNPDGGDDGIRTHDPHVANVMLSQLSYIPIV